MEDKLKATQQHVNRLLECQHINRKRTRMPTKPDSTRDPATRKAEPLSDVEQLSVTSTKAFLKQMVRSYR
jgi:hypothetical protein